VPLGEPYRALLVSAAAVVDEGKRDYVFVVDDRNVVERRPVTLGPLWEGLRAIKGGLSAHDWVVVTGVQRVRPGETVEPRCAPMPAPPLAPGRN
jgi:multidrug efflux pump subunit AcrA (membrane-fusion protein)